MRELRLTVIANWYLNRATELMEYICEGILDIKSDASENILPSVKVRKNLKKLTTQAVIYLNKASVYNPDLILTGEIVTRNYIIDFIYD